MSIALAMNSQNPLLKPFENTPHGTVPFDKITDVNFYEEAVDYGIAKNLEEIDAIVNNPEAPTFENTIVALQNAGQDLDRPLNVFYPLLSSLCDDSMIAMSDKILPKLSDHSTMISLNEGLWNRVKTVYDQTDLSTLSPEDAMLLTQTYDSFARNGALLKGADREKYRELSRRLSELTNKFGQNVLRELNTYEVYLTKDDLDGLPESSIEAAALLAKEKGREGEYLFTLDQPTYLAFLKYSSRRDLREKMYRLYSGRNMKGEFDNTPIIRDIANTRLELAKLLGYKSYSEYALERTMAEKPENVTNLLTQLRDAYRPTQLADFKELADFARSEGFTDKLQPWDYSYYSNRLRQARYNFDEESLRPYFELNNVIKGVFGLATSLYGVTFEENKDIPVYHPEVQAFEVKDADGSYLGVIYTDFFPRDTKRPGAWMTGFKDEWHNADGTSSRPHVSIVMNFTKPTETKPSLLTPYEVQTFLHEFGHALHGLLTNTKYRSLSGTSVYRDFVELPSQFNENYMRSKEFLDGFARHYQTGEPIPESELDKIIAASRYAAAYACLRQLNFGLIDMAWHNITEPLADDADVTAFENEAGKSVAMFEPVDNTGVSYQFSHIFSGGYASGYYSYKWAEVLDADAFSVFKKNGIYDKESADKFRHNILEKGGTVHPAELYRQFRGQDATIDALLERDGIKKPAPDPVNLRQAKDR